MRTIAITNQKGGCGKTTTTVNLAAAFAQKGLRTLLIDLDPQGHSTLGFGYDPETLDKTIYHALTNPQISISRVVLGTNIEKLDLAPSNILLSGAEIELAEVLGKELVLGEQLRMVNNDYDMVVIDCPPSVGLLTLNALVASTDVIVPVQVHYYAVEGLKQLFDTANIIRVHFHPCYVKILGLLLTFVENRTVFGKQIQRQMREYFGDLVFKTVIHRTVRLLEAPSAGESVLTYAPESKGAAEHLALAEEIMHDRPMALEMNNDEVSEEKINSAKALVDEISNEKPPDEETINEELLAVETNSDNSMGEPDGDNRPMAVEVSPEQSSGEHENNNESLTAQTSGDEPMGEPGDDDRPIAVEVSPEQPSGEHENIDEPLADQASGDEPMAEPGGDDSPMAVEVSPEQSSGEHENNDEPLADQASGDEPMAEQTNDDNPPAVEMNNDMPSTEETNNG